MRFRTLFAPALAALLLAGCDGLADLDVPNLNNPDTERVLATPGDVRSLVGGAYRTLWLGTHSYTSAGLALSVAANSHAASWGNFGMQDFGTQPRIALDNNPSWGYAYVIENPWSRFYGALKAVNDGLRAMDGLGGSDPIDLEDEADMVRAFAKLIQGAAHGNLAMIYDQGFIMDENVGPQDIPDLEMRPYDEIMPAAIAQLEEAIQIASAADDFSTPSSWINGQEVDNDLLVQLAHSYIARFTAGVARSPEEAEAVAWGDVITHARAGVTADFGPRGDGFSFWYDGLKTYGGVFPGWGRLDLRFLGMADTGGEYQAWMGLEPRNRTAFLIETPDRRVTGDAPDVDGEYVQHFSAIPFRPERGTYFFSNYGDMRWLADDECDDDVDPCDGAAFAAYGNNFTAQMTEVTPREMKLLEAEAHIWLNQPAQAVPLINETRETWLPAVTVDGVPDAADCVPHEPSSTAECGDLMTALHWEKWMETFHTGSAVEFTDARRWGFLISGTPLHLPVPGAELQILQLPIYTFGGAGEPGTAP